MFGLSPVTLSDVKNRFDPGTLQSSFETYLRHVTEGATLKVVANINAPNKFMIIGNPFSVTPAHVKEGGDLHDKDLAQKDVGKIACRVLNAGTGWKPYHFFDADTAEEFFKTCGATNKGDYILVNAHLKDASDAVHEFVHSYHGSDGRFDWLMNEGFTDWFAVDFANSPQGRAFPYSGGKLYTKARAAAARIVAKCGKQVVAKYFFGEERIPKFERKAKEFSRELLSLAQFDSVPDEYLKHFPVPPVPLRRGDVDGAAELILEDVNKKARSKIH